MAKVMQDWRQGDASVEEVLACLGQIRSACPTDANRLVDELLLRDIHQARAGLEEAQEALAAAQAIQDRLASAPLMLARYISPTPTKTGDMAVVAIGSGRRVVAVSGDVDTSALRCGDGVLLNSEQSALIASAPCASPPVGEVAVLDRFAGSRLVIKSREEEIVVEKVSALDDVSLRPGDTLRWDRQANLALEKMEGAATSPFVLSDIDDLPSTRVGGQKANLNLLRSALINSMLFPERAKVFDLPVSNTILLYGPPGSGKTYLTRAAFSELQRRSGKKVQFGIVKAASWESPYVGVTQANISGLFSNLRRVVEEGQLAALLIDEIDSVGRIRGSISGHHSDKALGTLLNELSGFEKFDNVSVLATVNRIDLLDSALLSRFGTRLPIRRPDMRSAREVFSVHLSETLPYAGDAREEMIDLAVSRLFAPNSDGEVAVLKLRDGRTRPVAARELVSARLIEQITNGARRRALDRWNETSVCELRVEDMEGEMANVRTQLAENLTPYNAHNQLDTLPADEVVLAVEPIYRRSDRSHRYVSLS
jgi:ATP-dependent 26S proteasome regulatory subunit